MVYLGIVELEFEKTNVIFEIKTLEFGELQNLEIKEGLNLGQKIPYLDIFGLKIKKKVLYLKWALSNLSNCKIFQRKEKCLNLGPKIPDLSVFRL